MYEIEEFVERPDRAGPARAAGLCPDLQHRRAAQRLHRRGRQDRASGAGDVQDRLSPGARPGPAGHPGQAARPPGRRRATTTSEVTAFGLAEPVVTPIEHPFVQRVIELSASFSEARPAIAPIDGRHAAPAGRAGAATWACPAWPRPATRAIGPAAPTRPTSTSGWRTCPGRCGSTATCSRGWGRDKRLTA